MQRLHSSFCDLDAEVGPAEPPDPRVRPTEQLSSKRRASDLADATMEDEARARRRHAAAEVSLDPDALTFGPPTDATLDASRENDHATRWYAPTPRPNRRLGIALLVFVLGYSAAAIVRGWWPFA